jgi:colanic acid biosynthesis glycosyl transferase WcaI
MPRPKAVLIVSQTFVPDPASVGQHVADVAIELARRGQTSGKFNVRVYASARGFENPKIIYPKRETLHNVDIRRIPFASFGKKSMLLRILGTAAFMIQAFFAVLFTPRIAGIFFSTSPPLIGLPMTIVAFLRRVPAVYWAMDLNPDQLIALGKLQPTQFTAKLLEAVNRFILNRSVLIIALDRFMLQRLTARGIPASKILVLPPWPHETHIQSEPEAPAENPFRTKHNLTNKFVIMYSGNHSPSNPLTTLLDAVVQLKDDPDLRFLFVGGGSGKKQVEQYIADHNLTNAISLPYQPLDQLKYSLSAADVHIVSLGPEMVGIVHPCKIYGAMAVARPVLFLGPRPSHIADVLDKHNIGIQISHGDLPAAIAAIHRLRQLPAAERSTMGQTAAKVLNETLSQSKLCGEFCDAVAKAMQIR